MISRTFIAVCPCLDSLGSLLCAISVKRWSSSLTSLFLFSPEYCFTSEGLDSLICVFTYVFPSFYSSPALITLDVTLSLMVGLISEAAAAVKFDVLKAPCHYTCSVCVLGSGSPHSSDLN